MSDADGTESAGPSAAESVAVLRWEEDLLSGFLGRMKGSDSLFGSVEALLGASSAREVLAVVQGHPDLLGDRGEAAVEVTRVFVESCGAVLLPPLLQDRAAWLAQLREASVDPSRIRLPDE